MLVSLDIKNIALIEQLNMDPEGGMTVLTGETGAGKSIIIDAVNLLLGSRTNKGLVRFDTEKARVQGVFTVNSEIEKMLEEFGIDPEDDNLIISREISSDGKSVCRINGIITPQNTLRSLGEYLINIHGQQDNIALLNPSRHIDFLDTYAKTELTKYQSIYAGLQEKKAELDSLKVDENNRASEIDYLKYQVSEIESANLTLGEKDELLKDKNIMANAEKIAQALSESRETLYGDNACYDLLSSSVSSLDRISGLDADIDEIAEKLRDLAYTIEDSVHELRRIYDRVEYDENILNDIEERLDTISKLERKYGGSIESVIEYGKKAKEKLEKLENADVNMELIKSEIEKLQKELTQEAEKITNHRKASASHLQEEIEASLKDLDMPKVKFYVEIANGEYTSTGCDKVEFMICPNVGEPMKPLAQIASGGELSRVMLAIKSILAEGADTLIFDEIDTGVSGNAALKIAKKLKELSSKKQVICVSHQPQLAAIADNHIRISKSEEGERTVTRLSKLSLDERITEIARIIDGDNFTETAVMHAREMLDLK